MTVIAALCTHLRSSATRARAAPDKSHESSAERVRRHRARAELRKLGYRLLDDVPIHPETLAVLVAAGLISEEAAADDRRLALAIGHAVTRLAELVRLAVEPVEPSDAGDSTEEEG